MKYFLGLCFCLSLVIPAPAETLPAGIEVIKSAVSRGDGGTFYRRVAVKAIIAREVDCLSWPKIVRPAVKFVARATANVYIRKEVDRLLRSGPGLRRAAVQSFKVHQSKVNGRQASLTASYSVPGAAETVGLALVQDKQDDWIVVGVNSGVLRRSIDRLLLK